MAKNTVVRLARRWLAPLAGLTALALAAHFYVQVPPERSWHLRATAGNALDTRHKLASLLQSELALRELGIDLQETAGSEDALDKVDKRQLDIAFVQGGLRSPHRPNVRQVATLYVEPLHLLVKKELHADISAHLGGLDGKVVNLGARGSGTQALASAVLAFIGLHARTPDRPRGYIPAHLSGKELLTLTDETRLPDAVFLVSSLPSDISRHLVNEHGYRLVPIAFGEAFALDAVGTTGSAEEGHVEKGRICVAAIPAYSYSVEPPVPATSIPSLGTRLLLVAHKDVDAQCIRELVELVFASEFAKTVRPPLDVKTMESPPEFPWHAGTVRYQARNRPVVSGMLMDSLQKAFAIFAAAASGLFVLWQWLKQRGQFMRDNGFVSYIGQVTRIEEQAHHTEHEPEVGRAQLLALRNQLRQLKTEALDRFAEGELQGKDLMLGFLTQVHDVRDYLDGRLSEKPAGDRSP